MLKITKIDLDFSGQKSKKSHFDSLVLLVKFCHRADSLSWIKGKKLTSEYLVKDKGKRKCVKTYNDDTLLNDAEPIDKP
ncbi:hypothetical protein BpHYR1_034875 [Brachionus plicatilis]|uniref:Uncharacterized protein n=1 Tax=Brachionus plicatilis TaxID=10195 RepID=A0A3M7Q349_BRAPC|nr:hypothetical protein BpHYR1_034875 [Brachionus plicatilis]